MSDLYQSKSAIRIPKKLEKKLHQDSELYGKVLSILSEFKPWVKNSGTPFFPEYTDHGIKHIEDVLSTIEWLISDESWEILSPSDSAVLILSVLLHDSALHLSEDGFTYLVGEENSWSNIGRLTNYFQDDDWSKLWIDFKSESKRFNQSKLLSLFGDTEPVHPPNLQYSGFSKKERLLIGDLIRRHHHRLAHEISIKGVPSPTIDKLKLRNLEPYFKDIIGLVARSHGLNIRKSFKYIEENYDLRDYNGIHIIYLMTLLRIADYLQIQPERALEHVPKTIHISSPLSKREFDLHNSIKNINITHEDLEAIYIDVKPTNVKVYLRLREWIEGIQYEIDTSWAVLGEIYSRFGENKLDKLGFKIRRVRSNIEDKEAFSSEVNYLPSKASFSVASAELIELLITPLYGNRPEVGIRELLQNSVDAVLEREEVPTSKRVKNDNFPDFKGEIKIEIVNEEEGPRLIISDKGIGMDSDTLINYFLKAGASFRRSKHWKEKFEDKKGRSKVLRSGRFGVGVLAAFLLGDKIKVSTRNIFETHGWEFEAKANSKTIQINKVQRPVGTTIQIKLTQETFKYLRDNRLANRGRSRKKQRSNWDWFCLDKPIIKRYFEDEELIQFYKIPAKHSILPEKWNKISTEKFPEIHWTYGKCPGLVCNGITIYDDFAFKNYENQTLLTSDMVFLKRPNISVFDPDGYLPLNLQRTELVDPLPFEEDLIKDVIRDTAANILVNGPNSSILHGNFDWYNNLNYKGFNKKSYHRTDRKGGNPSFWLSCRDGYMLADSFNIIKGGINRILLIGVDVGRKEMANIELTPKEGILVFPMTTNTRDKLRWVRFLFGGIEQTFRHIQITGTQAIIPKKASKYINKKGRLRKEIRHKTNKNTLDDWSNWTWGNLQRDSSALLEIAQKFKHIERWPKVLGEIYISPKFVKRKKYSSSYNPEKSLSERIYNLISDVLIPYDKDKRKTKLEDAYQRLEKYL